MNILKKKKTDWDGDIFSNMSQFFSIKEDRGATP